MRTPARQHTRSDQRLAVYPVTIWEISSRKTTDRSTRDSTPRCKTAPPTERRTHRVINGVPVTPPAWAADRVLGPRMFAVVLPVGACQWGQMGSCEASTGAQNGGPSRSPPSLETGALPIELRT